MTEPTMLESMLMAATVKSAMLFWPVMVWNCAVILSPGRTLSFFAIFSEMMRASAPPAASHEPCFRTSLSLRKVELAMSRPVRFCLMLLPSNTRVAETSLDFVAKSYSTPASPRAFRIMESSRMTEILLPESVFSAPWMKTWPAMR